MKTCRKKFAQSITTFLKWKTKIIEEEEYDDAVHQARKPVLIRVHSLEPGCRHVGKIEIMQEDEADHEQDARDLDCARLIGVGFPRYADDLGT